MTQSAVKCDSPKLVRKIKSQHLKSKLIIFLDCLFLQTYSVGEGDSIGVANMFPPGEEKGVSSIIMFGTQKWKLHYVVNGKTKDLEVSAGRYDDVAKIGNGEIQENQIFAVERVN